MHIQNCVPHRSRQVSGEIPRPKADYTLLTGTVLLLVLLFELKIESFPSVTAFRTRTQVPWLPHSLEESPATPVMLVGHAMKWCKGDKKPRMRHSKRLWK